MRSQLFRRSKLLLRSSNQSFHSVNLRLLCPNSSSSSDSRPTRSYATRSLSSKVADATDNASDSPSDAASQPSNNDSPETPTGTPEVERVKKARTSASTKEEPPELPNDLDIVWVPEGWQTDSSSENPLLRSDILPPPDILDEALHNLYITLHPQTQHRATYAPSVGQLVEPTLALYCPIEGADYVIDATVAEMARRTRADVLVLDAVQLAAGEWGVFGKAAASLQLPKNPLHFTSQSAPASNLPAMAEEEDDEPSSSFPFSRQMTLTLMSPSSLGSGMISPTMITSTSKRTTPASKMKTFFDKLVNLPAKSSMSMSSIRPRLIYIRDFPTLAPSSVAWYSPLLAAVRQRRRGAISRPSSPVTHPTTIIFGATAPLIPPPHQQASSGPGTLISLLTSRSSPQIVSNPKARKTDWGESEAADKSRERRLRERLKRWEDGDATLLEDIPKLSMSDDQESPMQSKPNIVIVGSSQNIMGTPANMNGRELENDASTSFFRASVLIPTNRSTVEERESRMARRREINELTMRMAVGAVGGVLEGNANDSPIIFPAPETPADLTSEDSTDTEPTGLPRMWDEWGRRIQLWSSVRHIADHAVGSVVAARLASSRLHGKSTLEPTQVPWSAVHKRWAVQQQAVSIRQNWMKEFLPASKIVNDQDEGIEDEDEADEDHETIIEQLKTDEDLDPHEHRLLPCIVDPASLPTSFKEVHLPPHTIDSIRTIVSLPLLHPYAFKRGVLKDHGMTGCLLFGPPGTGKTLAVRALAKEAGCRMMVVTPADVMDMYVGEGEKLVKAVFSLARRLSPCVIFLDEIDALFGARMSARESGGTFAHRGVITEFMQEMDGLKTSRDSNVVVIGATNRPFDLDDAVLRRLPRRLLVDLPGVNEREEILKIHLRDEELAPDVSVKDLAERTESFSGSDLKHVCVSAALDAVKENVPLPWVTVTGDGLVSKAIEAARVDSDPETPTNADPTKMINSLEEKIADFARTLSMKNFIKALNEITPSSSETLGSLTDLRRWNDEFGEGRKDKRKRQIWGKDRFGFGRSVITIDEDGRVVPSPPS